MRTKVIVAVVLVAALLLAGGFCAGSMWQRGRSVNVDIISYTGNNITRIQTLIMPVEKGQITLGTNYFYTKEYNISVYGIVIRPL